MTDKTMTGNVPRPNEPAHTPVMAQYLGVTLQAPWYLLSCPQVIRSVPLCSPILLTASEGK